MKKWELQSEASGFTAGSLCQHARRSRRTLSVLLEGWKDSLPSLAPKVILPVDGYRVDTFKNRLV